MPLMQNADHCQTLEASEEELNHYSCYLCEKRKVVCKSLGIVCVEKVRILRLFVCGCVGIR